ncbi:adenosylcobinamide-phosphate synthase CbiB [Desulfosudis oleivorans]|nr:adenosylcobinamide-phosphate synthase CbiB [Desulfosudis oleivorans]
MFFDLHWAVILAAFILDFFVGDPDFFAHPARLMGRAINTLEPVFRKLSRNPVLAGGLFAIALIAGTWLVALFMLAFLEEISPAVRVAGEVVLLFFCISARSLEKGARAVLVPLAKGDIYRAREGLCLIVGRDVHRLDEKGVARATVETVAENLVDGVISPLFFAVIGGVPLALAYKMVNTLDSMVGYKDDRYEAFGKASARIDDGANFIPARLSVAIIAAAAFLLFRKGGAAFKTALRDGRCHSSPNAGYAEAAFAGALGLWMGGASFYQGQRVDKPVIGAGLADTDVSHISESCRLMLLASTLAVVLAALARTVL